jgi:hypothetical protein
MMRNRAVHRTAAFATLVSFFTACYTQRPIDVSVPAPATRIIAQVTDTGSVAMANTIGAAALEVEGVVAEADAGTWRLHLLRVDHRGGNSSRWNRETVTFPRYALTNVRETRLDKKRSWIVGGIAAGAIVALTVLFGSVLSGSTGDGEPPPPV